MVKLLTIFQSTSVADAVFATNWMDADVRIQKMIIIIIKRSHSPESLTGMDFFAASFPSIAKVSQLEMLVRDINLYRYFIADSYHELLVLYPVTVDLQEIKYEKDNRIK